MKKYIALFLFAAIVLSCKQQKQAEGYTINVTVPADTKGWVYLKELKGREYIALDSVQIAGNKVVFKGSVAQPMVYVLSPEQKSKRVQVYVENAPLNVGITPDWEIESLSGAADAQLFNDLLPRAAAGTLKTDSLLKSNPSSPLGLYFLNRETYKFDYNQLKELRSAVSDSLKNHPYTAQLDEEITALSKIQPGQPAPDFTLETPDGNSLSLGSLKGKYVLMDFWASWCPDCRKTNPELVKIYDKFKDKNFTILGVSLDEDKDKWRQAIEKDGLTWNHVVTTGGWENPVTALYAIKWIPMSFLINPEGVIVERTADVKIIEQKLTELLK